MPSVSRKCLACATPFPGRMKWYAMRSFIFPSFTRSPSVFQRAVYDRLAFACAAYAAPLFVALGAVVVAPALLRGLLLLALTLYAGLLTVLAVRAACKVSWTWALVAGIAGVLCALLPLAAVAGAWAGLTG